ncbi:hypothetical protein GCM10009551_017170 [Nocardiopsis tropica]
MVPKEDDDRADAEYGPDEPIRASPFMNVALPPEPGGGGQIARPTPRPGAEVSVRVIPGHETATAVTMRCAGTGRPAVAVPPTGAEAAPTVRANGFDDLFARTVAPFSGRREPELRTHPRSMNLTGDLNHKNGRPPAVFADDTATRNGLTTSAEYAPPVTRGERSAYSSSHHRYNTNDHKAI